MPGRGIETSVPVVELDFRLAAVAGLLSGLILCVFGPSCLDMGRHRVVLLEHLFVTIIGRSAVQPCFRASRSSYDGTSFQICPVRSTCLCTLVFARSDAWTSITGLYHHVGPKAGL